MRRKKCLSQPPATPPHMFASSLSSLPSYSRLTGTRQAGWSFATAFSRIRIWVLGIFAGEGGSLHTLQPKKAKPSIDLKIYFGKAVMYNNCFFLLPPIKKVMKVAEILWCNIRI